MLSELMQIFWNLRQPNRSTKCIFLHSLALKTIKALQRLEELAIQLENSPEGPKYNETLEQSVVILA